MHIVPITLPTPFPVGPVNVYLITDDPVTLIDTGPRTKEALEALREGLRRAGGLRVFDLRRIVLTHTHDDHCGLIELLLAEAKQVEVLVHAWEQGHVASDARQQYEEQRHALLVRAGVPDEEIESLRRMYAESHERYGSHLAKGEYRELADDEELQFATGALRVVHTPGHTPGSCCLVREANRTVIAGDTILKRITPNPILSPDPINPEKRFHSLEEFLVSLARLRTFAPTLTYGGHGDPVTDYEELFNRFLRHIHMRQTEVLEAISKEGVTAWDVACKLFPDTDQMHRFLAVSEAAAHLDLAHTEGKVAVEISSVREIYRRRKDEV